MISGDKSSKIVNEVTVNFTLSKDLTELKDKVTSILSLKGDTTSVVEYIIAGAINSSASDVHFEPGKDITLIRFRMDGVLREVLSFSTEDYHFILSRLKLLSGVRLNISDAAQDGRFTITASDQSIEIEVRASFNPSEYGETVVLRLLDPRSIDIEVKDLGLREDDSKIIGHALRMPNGMILTTGPTGSGKTTTLYAFLKGVRNPEIKVITIEDPIEYHLDGIQQTQVDDASGYTFENGLRSLLRQDPDVILVGEIRDLETAEIAMHAALTGHLVFSTLHTNSSIGAIPRLIDLGIKPQIIGSSVNIVIAQRLVRKLCPYCRAPKEPSPDLKEKISKFIEKLPQKVDKKPYENITLYEAKGCDRCHNGYKGRIGLFEILEISKDFEPLLREDVGEYEIEQFARNKGFVSLQEDGVLKIISGATDFSEVEKVTGPIDW